MRLAAVVVVFLAAFGLNAAADEEPTPSSIVVVDCFDNFGDPCPTTTTTTLEIVAPTTTTEYVPSAADLNDLPIEPVAITPHFTG